ncbi:MAG: carbamoyl-phosphate synthase domain-containing protein, partial [bacterium]
MGARLILEDGSVIEGASLGARKTVFGELVFNTSMTGYQEALTDPSYAGQILMFTYPLVGNYGVHPGVGESPGIKAWGCVVREACPDPWHPASRTGLDGWLQGAGVPGIAGVDTRALTVKCRTRGTMKAILTTDPDEETEALQRRLATTPPVETENLVAGVAAAATTVVHGPGPRVVLVDCGVKASIVRELAKRCEVVRVPWNARADEVLAHRPRGVVLS